MIAYLLIGLVSAVVLGCCRAFINWTYKHRDKKQSPIHGTLKK